jgi:NitT/TauT family transport system permease protein
MDVIIPYVAWITLLSFIIDRALEQAAHKAFPWAYVQEPR